MESQKPERFSQLYLERGNPTRESTRLRNRLAAYFSENLSTNYNYPSQKLYEAETGAVVPRRGQGWIFSDVFREAELRDVLDAITIVYRVVSAANNRTRAADWLTFVARSMREENVGYTVDSIGTVHFHVDQEFERNRSATLAVLQLPQFAAVRAAFEDSFRHLDALQSDTKAAVRSMFEALEILARLVVPEAKNLNKWLVENTLKQKCLIAARGDAVEKKVLAGLFDSFADWVDALHTYRHGQAVEEPVAPSEEMSVHILATGSAYLRQIATFAIRIGAGKL